MPRQTYPRPDHHHAIAASRVLARHASTVGMPVDLPVPIELIIEKTYRLEILWEDVPELADTIVLGALAPRDRRIVLNSRHQALFEQYMGPERFTWPTSWDTGYTTPTTPISLLWTSTSTARRGTATIVSHKGCQRFFGYGN